MEGDCKGVRIIPSKVEFSDVQANKQQIQKINITVKNIDKHSREIRCHPPESKVRCFYTTYIFIKFKTVVNRLPTSTENQSGNFEHTRKVVEFYPNDGKFREF